MGKDHKIPWLLGGEDYCRLSWRLATTLEGTNVFSHIWGRSHFYSYWFSFLILTLSDNQCLLCSRLPNDEYLVASLPGFSGGPCGASHCRVPDMGTLTLAQLLSSLLQYLPPAANVTAFRYWGSYTQKASLLGGDRQTGPSYLLSRLPSSWKAHVSLTCQVSACGHSTAVTSLRPTSSFQFPFPLLRQAQGHESKLFKWGTKVIQSSLLENTNYLHRCFSWSLYLPGGGEGKIPANPRGQWRLFSRFSGFFHRPGRKTVVIVVVGLIWLLFQTL